MFHHKWLHYERQYAAVAKKVLKEVQTKIENREAFVVVVVPEIDGVDKVAEYNTDLSWYQRNQETWFGKLFFVRVPEYLKQIAQ